MAYLVLFQQIFKFFLNKMSIIAANKDLKDPKAREDNFLKEQNHPSGVIVGASNDLHSLKDIVVATTMYLLPWKMRRA